ncbi:MULTISPECIES: aspartate/glutamate racemase family protein [unclassified Chelatococcus]|uniref:aspartate/glutamate racemase family protein n=1 Tax=unclassified Chelatococcus TaxID=2638111 RepID=UPI001BD041F7|nr:aspartate/glutamate racemase family protein [Chelatococcus sp.]MBS7701175.1 Asp/Glu racemase [Chelatococcus sp. YT9]MBX3557306.1 Asp/Glu racemase [Chelatococcus sp.]
MARRTIYVLNPSSRTDTGITEDMQRSLRWLVREDGPDIRCLTLSDGPNGIKNAGDSDKASPAILSFIERECEKPEVAGFVIACFSDPAVFSARELTAKPVIGIGEAGIMAGLALGDLVGTIGVSGGNPVKGLRFARRLGVRERVAGHVGLGLDYGQLQDPAVVENSLIKAGLALRDEHGADTIVFAGAGLARYVASLGAATGLPVVDPTQAAAALALTQAASTCG